MIWKERKKERNYLRMWWSKSFIRSHTKMHTQPVNRPCPVFSEISYLKKSRQPPVPPLRMCKTLISSTLFPRKKSKTKTGKHSLPCLLILPPTSIFIDEIYFVLVEQLVCNHSLQRSLIIIIIILLDQLPFFVVPPDTVRADAP